MVLGVDDLRAIDFARNIRFFSIGAVVISLEVVDAQRIRLYRNNIQYSEKCIKESKYSNTSYQLNTTS
jgi:hypothetical protein